MLSSSTRVSGWSLATGYLSSRAPAACRRRADFDIEHVGADRDDRRAGFARLRRCPVQRRSASVSRRHRDAGSSSSRGVRRRTTSSAACSARGGRALAVLLHPGLVGHPGQHAKNAQISSRWLSIVSFPCGSSLCCIAASVRRGCRTAPALLAAAAAGWLITTMSKPASPACCCRNDSLMIRLIRFRRCRRQCFFEIARPSLATACHCRRQSTVKICRGCAWLF